MKLVTFIHKSDPIENQKIGVLLSKKDKIADLQSGQILLTGKSNRYFSSMLSLLEGGNIIMDMAREVSQFISDKEPQKALINTEDAILLSPVPRPLSIRDCISFEKHLVQATRTILKWKLPLLARIDGLIEKKIGRSIVAVPKIWYKRPIYYKSNTLSVVGTNSEVLWPSYTKKLDYELEFGIYIGKKGKNISEKNAEKHIAGYTIFNDFSARDIQPKEMQGRLGPSKSKDFDTGNVIGPYLVTPDEIDDPYNLTMKAFINDILWSAGNSRDMHFSFPEIISYISKDETLYPGEFIGSGTVGNGCGLELDRWIQPNDTIELKVEGLGTLKNKIIAN